LIVKNVESRTPNRIPERAFSTAFAVSLLLAAFGIPLTGQAMEIQWTSMAGQWPVEASPVVIKSLDGGSEEILILNRGGQLLLWTADGKPVGSGQDGMAAQLPEGSWTTAPTIVADPASATHFVVASVEGLVLGLDRQFRKLWEYKLPGKTVWGCAMPASIRLSNSLVFSDLSGTATCLSLGGKMLWTNALAAGASKAPAQKFHLKSDTEWSLIPSGSTLFCCDDQGHIRWRTNLSEANIPSSGQEIVTRPEVLLLKDRSLIICGTAAGKLFALDSDGKTLWQCAIEDVFSRSITFVPRKDSTPLILFAGLWGNLHAVDITGKHLWTHLFRTKVRGTPLVLEDEVGQGRFQIFVPTFHQHVYQFNENGELTDDIRLSGIMPSALTPIRGQAGAQDFLVTTTTLLAYRLRPGTPASQYGAKASAQNVSVHPPLFEANQKATGVIVKNPNGALLKTQLSMTDTSGWTRIVGLVTARSALEIPLPNITTTGRWSCRATVQDWSGKMLDEKTWQIPSEENTPRYTTANPASTNTLFAWPTPPYGAFEETRLRPTDSETILGTTNSISNLYLDGSDQGAFIVASRRDQSTEARITVTRPVRADGQSFGGAILLREVIPTGSVNGEQVPDALPALNNAGLVRLAPNRSIKIWVSIDTHGAQAGSYAGSITFTPLSSSLPNIELPLRLEILNLRLPKEFPLRLCTWDYVPNRWFQSRSSEVLEDMSRHGVNIFPRSTIPPGRVDGAGKLGIDWTVLDAELDRLEHRGKILFQLGHPPIQFPVEKGAEDKHALELEYIRALRDRLKTRGWSNADYAFYLLDEPGLDYGTNVPVLLDAGKLFREADPQLLTYTDPVPGLSWKDFQLIEPLVDVWAPNMRLVSGLLSGDPRIQQIMKKKTVWSYECVSQVKSLSPLRYNRANAWRAQFFGLSGIGFWTHSTTEADIWFGGKTINDEYALVYPGELPVPSVRWEAVRDGLEDVAAMTLLKEQIKKHRDAGTQSALVEQAEQELRIALCDVMELSDEAFVESRDFLREGDRVIGHTGTDVSLFAHHREEIARFTLALSGN